MTHHQQHDARALTEAFLLARFADDDDVVGYQARWWQLAGRVVLLRSAPEWLVRRMAAHRSDHPDYREEWRPDA